eukprot:13104134-Ditylum_brightwellii.AAC.1
MHGHPFKVATAMAMTKLPWYELPKRDTQAYALILWQTQFDVKLYEHVLGAFEMQTKHWDTKARKKVLKKKKDGK